MIINMEKFNYEWKIKDSIFTKDKGTVFSCFACGGGSTMGYKLAGFDVIGCNEIDPRMNNIYVANHNPKINLLMDIREMVSMAKVNDLPKVVVAENVKGLLIGEAKQYVMKIYEAFEKAGYYCQHFLLNGSNMGLPQRRERVFLYV